MFPAHPFLETYTEKCKEGKSSGVCLEKQATKSEQPKMNHANYGWEENEAIKPLIPVNTGVKLGHENNALFGVLTIAMYTTPNSL